MRSRTRHIDAMKLPEESGDFVRVGEMEAIDSIETIEQAKNKNEIFAGVRGALLILYANLQKERESAKILSLTTELLDRFIEDIEVRLSREVSAGILAEMNESDRKKKRKEIGKKIENGIPLTYEERQMLSALDSQDATFAHSAAADFIKQSIEVLPTIDTDMSVGSALEKLEPFVRAKTRDTFVVLDPKTNCPVGLIEFLTLLEAELEATVGTLPLKAISVSVSTDTTKQEALELMEKHGVNILPVVDSDGRIFGVIEQNTAMSSHTRSKTLTLTTATKLTNLLKNRENT